MDAAQDIPPGLCHCGCGEEAAIPKRTNAKFGHIKGQPSRYKLGHGNSGGPEYETGWNAGYETPCWRWLRYVCPQGYGRAGGARGMAHRMIWERHHGPVPEGLELDHLCRNRACVNPDHLEPVTPIENCRRSNNAKLTMDDAIAIRASSKTPLELARQYGVARPTIYGLLKRRTWKGF